MGDFDRVPADHPRTGLAARAEPGHPHLAHEARVTQPVAELDDLVVERGAPDVRVVGEAGREVGDEALERVGLASPADAGLAFTAQVIPDRLAVPAEVTGDGRDRPSPLSECMCFHVFSR